MRFSVDKRMSWRQAPPLRGTSRRCIHWPPGRKFLVVLFVVFKVASEQLLLPQNHCSSFGRLDGGSELILSQNHQMKNGTKIELHKMTFHDFRILHASRLEKETPAVRAVAIAHHPYARPSVTAAAGCWSDGFVDSRKVKSQSPKEKTRPF